MCHKPTTCEVCFSLCFDACHMPMLNHETCAVLFFLFSFLVNGKGVDKRTNVSMVSVLLHILASMPSEPLVRLHFFNWKAELVHFKQDLGPQFPSDITKMLKYGANIIQAVGYFNGICLVAVLCFLNCTVEVYTNQPQFFICDC